MQIWYSHAHWHAIEGGGGPAAAAQVLSKGRLVLPDCSMLHFAAADLEESRGELDNARGLYEELVGVRLNDRSLFPAISHGRHFLASWVTPDGGTSMACTNLYWRTANHKAKILGNFFRRYLACLALPSSDYWLERQNRRDLLRAITSSVSLCDFP